MNDNDYIRKAVELADGYVRELFRPHVEAQQWHLDALAAQLVRQVDATKTHWVRILPDSTTIFSKQSNDALQAICGKDRTMNTIKAIVDSKVLEV